MQTRTFPSNTMSTTNSTWTDQWLNRDMCEEGIELPKLCYGKIF